MISMGMAAALDAAQEHRNDAVRWKNHAIKLQARLKNEEAHVAGLLAYIAEMVAADPNNPAIRPIGGEYPNGKSKTRAREAYYAARAKAEKKARR